MYCPECGRRLTNTKYRNAVVNVCMASNCRTIIIGNKIDKASLETYTKICDAIEPENEDDTLKYYMLLKEKSNQPLLVKNTNNALEKNKDKLCIIQCKSKDDAKSIFKSMFQYIVINDDNIAEVNIIRE